MEKNNKRISGVWELLTSMKFGMMLLFIIAVLSVLGTVIPQEYQLQYYEASYSKFSFELIKAFSLHKVFTSWWFITLIVILCINLLLCSIRRIGSIFDKIFKKPDLYKEFSKIKSWEEVNVENSDITIVFKTLNFKNVIETDISIDAETSLDISEEANSQADLVRDEISDSKSIVGRLYFSDKGKIGHIGSWLTHLGILIIAIFFTFGKIKGFDEYVFGVPGDTLDVDNTDLSIYIEDFEVKFREDFSVEQYISDVVVLKNGEIEDAGKISVNHPMRTNNVNIYQNSTGWALDAILYKNEEEYAKQLVYEGDLFVEDNQKIAIQFTRFYPDFDHDSEGMTSKTPLPNHPVMIYALFYDGYRVDMNLAHMGTPIEYEEYKFVFEEPQRYTMFQVAHDPGKTGAFIGGSILTLGIFLAMFVNPKKLFIFIDNEDKIKIYGKSHKSNVVYQEEILAALEKAGREEE